MGLIIVSLNERLMSQLIQLLRFHLSLFWIVYLILRIIGSVFYPHFIVNSTHYVSDSSLHDKEQSYVSTGLILVSINNQLMYLWRTYGSHSVKAILFRRLFLILQFIIYLMYVNIYSMFISQGYILPSLKTFFVL